VLPPEVRHGRMGDKCWPRDRSITESDDAKGKRTKRRSERRLEGIGKGRMVS